MSNLHTVDMKERFSSISLTHKLIMEKGGKFKSENEYFVSTINTRFELLQSDLINELSSGQSNTLVLQDMSKNLIEKFEFTPIPDGLGISHLTEKELNLFARLPSSPTSESISCCEVDEEVVPKILSSEAVRIFCYTVVAWDSTKFLVNDFLNTETDGVTLDPDLIESVSYILSDGSIFQ